MNKIPDNMIAGTIYKTKGFGEVKVIRYSSCSDVTIKFLDTGNVSTSRSGQIRSGQVRDVMKRTVFGVGYFGKGDHKSKNGKHHTTAYSKWQGMMERCYSNRYHENKPTYIGCSVCDAWHNFQNFAEWFYENYKDDGTEYHLDKDIKIKGNRVYSPDACLFVTLSENNKMSQSKFYDVKSPSGELIKVYNMAEFCRENGLVHGGMSKVARGERRSYKGWLVSYSPSSPIE
jgi:hypothetical protein